VRSQCDELLQSAILASRRARRVIDTLSCVGRTLEGTPKYALRLPDSAGGVEGVCHVQFPPSWTIRAPLTPRPSSIGHLILQLEGL
jgi:hypothetical protein